MILAIALLLAAAGQDESKLSDEELKEKLASFAQAKKIAKSDDQLIAALQLLASSPHPKILKELSGYLKKGSPPVRKAVVVMMGQFKGSKAAAAELGAQLESEASKIKAQKGHETAAVILEALAAVHIRESLPKIHALFRHVNFQLCKAAVDAARDFKRSDSVEPLIGALVDVEQAVAKLQKATPDKIGAEGIEAHQTAGMKINVLGPAIQQALREITRLEGVRASSQWSSWWSENKARVKEAEAEEDKKK